MVKWVILHNIFFRYDRKHSYNTIFASTEKVRKLTSEVFRVENEMEITIHVGEIGRGGGGGWVKIQQDALDQTSLMHFQHQLCAKYISLQSRLP